MACRVGHSLYACNPDTGETRALAGAGALGGGGGGESGGGNLGNYGGALSIAAHANSNPPLFEPVHLALSPDERCAWTIDRFGLRCVLLHDSSEAWFETPPDVAPVPVPVIPQRVFEPIAMPVPLPLQATN